MGQNINKGVHRRITNDIKDESDFTDSIDFNEASSLRMRIKLSKKRPKTCCYGRTYDLRKYRAENLREELEQKNTLKKFLVLHRHEIFDKYKEIENSIIENYIRQKKNVKSFKNLIKLFKVSKHIINKYYVLYY